MSLPRFLLAGVPALALAASGAAAGETAGLPGGAACLLTGCTMSGALSTTGLTTDARPPAVFPLPANTPGMVSPDTSRPFSFVGDVTSLAGESPGGLLYVSKNVGGWQGYVTTTASAASSGRIVSPASTADLYAGMTLSGVPVTAIGAGTVTLASALAIAKGATLNFIGAGNGAAIDALVTYRDGPNSNEVAVNGAINIVATRNSQGDAIHGASAIGVSGVANCYAVGCIDGWAGLFAYYDLTGQSNPPHAQYDLELDMYVNGDDQHQQRIDVAFGVNHRTATKWRPRQGSNLRPAA